MKILVVEDEARAVQFLRRGLAEEGFTVDTATDGGHADEMVAVNPYSAIVLDVMLPGADGFELCERWRRRGVAAPILFLTARDDVADRVRGLNLGADDYLVKPFAFSELVARLRALLRRNSAAPAPAAIRVGELCVDPARREVTRAGDRIALTPREFGLLEFLARNAGHVVTRTALWEHVWESGTEPDSNVVEVYVSYLRGKLGRSGQLIETVRGVGYRLNRRADGRDG